jgi:rubredoxin
MTTNVTPQHTLLFRWYKDSSGSGEAVHVLEVSIPSSSNSSAAVPLSPIPTQISWSMNSNNDIHIRLRWEKVGETGALKSNPQPSNQSSLRCRHCMHLLGPLTGFTKVASLPSDAWEELKEVWVCACTSNMLLNNPTLHNMHSSTHGSIPARQGALFVGLNHVLVHRSDLDAAAILIDTSILFQEKRARWANVLCNRCCSPLGSLFLAPQLDADPATHPQPPSSDIKLHKHAIHIASETGSAQNLFKSHSVASLVASTLYQAVRAHASYHFVVKSRTTMYCKIRITVVSWNTAVAVQERQHHAPVVSLMFMLLSDKHQNRYAHVFVFIDIMRC